MEGKRHLLRKRKSDIGKADIGKTESVCIYKEKIQFCLFFLIILFIHLFLTMLGPLADWAFL